MGLMSLIGLLWLLPLSGQAQKIGGNVYGGGNKGYVGGNTRVTVKAGDIGARLTSTDDETPLENPKGKVFGGARMADVGGNASVLIDGENATDYIVINYVYGGNDIAGTIGTGTLPEWVTAAKQTEDGINDTWNSFVHISTKLTDIHYTQAECDAYNTENGLKVGDEGFRTTADVKTKGGDQAPDAEKIYIGQVFAGGNGDYTYEGVENSPEEGKTTHNIYSKKSGKLEASIVTASGEAGFVQPEVSRAYLDIEGGSIDYAYGGGNNATVREENVIHVANPSKVTSHILVDATTGVEASAATYATYDEDPTTVPDGYKDLLFTARFKDMGINTGFSHPSSDEFQIGRLFGGNNMAEMSIHPRWNLQSGKVRNLYSGGNKGHMTHHNGLFLEIPESSTIVVDNVYGGCRMADVRPLQSGTISGGDAVDVDHIDNISGDYFFPRNLAARLLIRGGDINNVYGGNDVRGKVYFGNAVGVSTSIRGDIYGGGNGAYPYTDKEDYIDHDVYGDLYYSGSLDALNAIRPNAEQVSIVVRGKDAEHPTIIGGSIYCGGNCATLKMDPAHVNLDKYPLVELKMGSHVIADNVFLGNNGKDMVRPEWLELYATDNYATFDLTDPSVFAEYMEGAAMDLRPTLTFEKKLLYDRQDYIPYSSYIGSLFLGGNVGSMTYEGKNNMMLDAPIIVYNKVVGGCNNANVAAQDRLNAAYEGGIRGTAAEHAEGGYMEGGKIKDRLELTFNGLKIEPRRLYSTIYNPVANGTKLTKDETYYTSAAGAGKFTADGTEEANGTNYFTMTRTRLPQPEWNTVKWNDTAGDFVEIGTSATADDGVRRLLDGNVYGGCYNSGHVNGNVVININKDLIDRTTVFADSKEKPEAPEEVMIDPSGNRNSGVPLFNQAEDLMPVAMTVFGGGYGEDTEIWGSTEVNLNKGYAMQVFGGGYSGVVGKKTDVLDPVSGKVIDREYEYNPAYSTTVWLNGEKTIYSSDGTDPDIPECENLYGGGNEGNVSGDTHVYLGNGRIYDAFGGACNADILGATEIFIGRQKASDGTFKDGFPWIRDNIYGGNDFGGTVQGAIAHTTDRTPFDATLLESSTFVKYIQGRVDTIFGGNYGCYDYKDRIYKDYTDADGNPLSGFSFPGLRENSYVHFQPLDNPQNAVGVVFGGSEGTPNHVHMNNVMQKESYVYVDDELTTDGNRYVRTDFYGGGAYAGVGEANAVGSGRTVVDLFAGKFNNVYGGSNREGLIGTTRVNVPSDSRVNVNSIFGGGKGYEDSEVEKTRGLAARFCDTYITCVDYQGADAIVRDAIYGGNHNRRIAYDTYLNVGASVNQDNGYQATIYGAGYGSETVSSRTNIYMNKGSNAYKVFGGGRDGNVYNFESLKKWLGLQFAQEASGTSEEAVASKVTTYGGYLQGFRNYIQNKDVMLPEPISDSEYKDGKYYDNLWKVEDGQLKDTKDYYNTNVHINKGGNVTGYAFGGGYGEHAVVSGTTYIELKGGNVDKDIYGGGQGGPVMDEFDFANDEDQSNDFTATTNVNIEGGMVRNVYGGGYLGHVGKHAEGIDESDANDIPAVANVVIGKKDGTSFLNGIPAVMRNAYGGGEGGSVYGDAHVTLNNGYIGYRYENTAAEGADPVYKYVEELDDQKPGDLDLSGNVFGGGYVVNSYVDNTQVDLYGGIVRGSVYGGGEVGPVGRGSMKSGATGGFENGEANIYKGGSSQVNMFDGHVLRNVFGGGRGKDSWGGDGTMYMDKDLVATLDMKSKGFVFGQTRVNIHGGEIGTAEGVLKGFGNVFGAGDEGCVYSATGKKVGTDRSDEHLTNGVPTDGGGFYYTGGVIANGLSHDCNVNVAPRCKVIADGDITIGSTIGSTTYKKGDYIQVTELNKLKNWNADARWNKLDTRGIIIHNAVFAGGNETEGGESNYANTPTVFGNAGASIRDVYNVDLISIGTDDIGGIYGEGNLTLVDGFRELHIDNYGTDYYSLNETLKLEDYNKLSPRQQAYYRLMYVTEKDDHTFEYYESQSLHSYGGKDYRKGQKVDADTYASFTADEKKFWAHGTKAFKKDDQIEESEYILMSELEKEKWKLFGVTSIYAGRPMNTIQRADMCGVFGSRMVLRGAQDRVPEVMDDKNYTINRVDEVSLNKRVSEAGDSETIEDKDGNTIDNPNYQHGNYFGIYNVVNYLGNLTSDVFFDDIRETNTNIESNKADGTTTYYQWKAARPQGKYRNNGTSRNKVALASGVFLEIKREEGEALGKDVWGYITGVIELDLINVMTGMGGGYVYARNEHGTKTWHGVGSASPYGKVTLLDENRTARTYRRFEYTKPSETSSLQPIQTSGNFVHNTKQIVDDCYPNSNMYKDGYVASPAHYWYIRGQIYVYDQYISAYTGSANAYAEKVEIPLTISAASHGKMTLREVQPNVYAYYDKNGNKMRDPDASGASDDHVIINGNTYRLNDPVSYWDYNLMSEADKAKFVPETYVVIDDCTVGSQSFAKGDVLTQDEYVTLRGTGTDGPAVTYEEGGETHTDGNFDYFFRMSNNLSREAGYLLTYEVNNPMEWDKYYTKKTAPAQTNKLNTEDYNNPEKTSSTEKANYFAGPTFTPTTSGVYAQQDIKQGEIVFGTTKENYETNVKDNLSSTDGQAIVAEAYVVTKEHSVRNDEDGTEEQHLNPGTPIYQSDYSPAQWAAIDAAGAAEKAKVCTSLLDLSINDYVYPGQLLTSADISTLKTKVKALKGYTDDTGGKTAAQKAEDFLKDYISDAYICTQAGKYGGTYFEKGNAYRAIDTWCSMSDEDRQNFTYNYDAFDLLTDPTYGGTYGYKPQYDGPLDPKIYSATKPIDYKVELQQAISYTDEKGKPVSHVASSDEEKWLTREQFEDIPNEKHHYSPITIKAPGTYYMVHTAFMRGDIPYTVGQQIDTETYNSLSNIQKENIDELTFKEEHNPKEEDGDYAQTLYYYCREPYTVGEKGEGQSVTTMGVKTGATVATYDNGQEVPAGVIINQTTYNSLPNKQQNFIIHGTSPTETSTLYVTNESDINDLSKEKIITVIYLYEYEESDESGNNVTPVSERHIVNVHVRFQSGVPEIGELNPPALVLPGTSLGLNIPTVTPGAFHVTESGWEIFDDDSHANTHYNGQSYTNNTDPVYWYQNNYWIAYYAKTRLGKTYSNSVPIRVGNYHDLKKVMDDKKHHYYIDHKDVDYEPKIYINDYTVRDASGNETSESQSGIDLFRQLIDLSYEKLTFVDGEPKAIVGGELDGHVPLADNSSVKKPLEGGKYLEFILRADQSAPSGSATWTPIAGDGKCFSGVLHGDGYTVRGLDHSLFGHLCGDVYNLGVTGSFTSAGVADEGEGYVENCWVKSTATSLPEGTSKVNAVFGEPTASGKQQVVNSYFLDSNAPLYNTATSGGVVTSGDDTHGKARALDAKAFYNGTLAYDLNGFYLYKRYNDREVSEGTPYTFYAANADGTLSEPQTKWYANQPEFCSSGYVPASAPEGYKIQKYVENRFADGDFRYAAGSVPSSPDERIHEEKTIDPSTGITTVTATDFYPIWPDDYLFFGQALNYDHIDGLSHQDVPTAIRRTDGRVDKSEDGNRVYRAPAYFGSKHMDVAHFNPYAVFAQSKKDDAAQVAYKGMTAIDFTGSNGDVAGGYKLGWGTVPDSSTPAFYQPLLDDDGISGFRNVDLTRNLLAYTATPGTATPAAVTGTTVRDYLTDPAYTETHEKYRTVAYQDPRDIYGHWVELSDAGMTSSRDHLLVDRQDFNAPMSYRFATGKRMWYQRTPDTYVEPEWSGTPTPVRTTSGWEGVSLPFSAELVTTNQKGEITHFYSGSEESKNGTHSKIGHEYWLRGFTGIQPEGDKATAQFIYPSAADGSQTLSKKTVENTFLWDYYYKAASGHKQKDYNADTYQTYYEQTREYSPYPMLTKAVPYIIGFPGKTYYEFDLSGEFHAGTTALPKPYQIGRQTITFASPEGITIGVSDDEMTGVTYAGYTFQPSYMNREMTAGTPAWTLTADGKSYDKLPDTGDATTVAAFRPYFRTASGSGVKEYKAKARTIVFSNVNAQMFRQEEQEDDISSTGQLIIRAEEGKIVVSSTLAEPKLVNIVSASGAAVDRYTIQPGETRESTVIASGVYIVNQKKLSVRIKK